VSALTVYLPDDAAALSVGADEVAEALEAEARARGVALTLVRTGSRGLLWLEPLAEVERDGVRCAYGPLTPDDVPGFLDAALGDGAHPARIGPIEEHPYFAHQTRLTFARCGVIEIGRAHV